MIEGQEGVTWEQWVKLARTAEEAGIEALFRSDHYLGIGRKDAPGGSLDAWTTLAGLAAVTDRIRLGSLVSPVTFRPAAVFAKSVTTVDHISGGRVEPGIGAGWFEPEHDVYGFPFLTARERVALLREHLETIVRHWTEDERVLPKPVQQPHPPLIVGGAGKPGTVGPAVRWANEYNTTGASPEACRRRRETLDSACEQAGRDPATLPLSLMRTCIVGLNEADLRNRVARYVDLYQPGRSVDDVLHDVEPEDLIGTVEQVAERLREYERAGVTRVMLQHLVHEDLEMVEVIGRELRPAVASAPDSDLARL
jgi:alkanesulfonate monooxygenase SsuD/methylene tetrahydromethanopterin reductase-like flavin-dependent oxidoreductase (luciferase family)